jgi:hypothetical protein
MSYLLFAILALAGIGIIRCFYIMSRDVNKVLPPEERFPLLVDNGRSFNLIRAYNRHYPQSRLQWWIGFFIAVGIVCVIMSLTHFFRARSRVESKSKLG